MTSSPRRAGPPAAGLRLNRYVALGGVASRRGADRLVAEGRVRVNGRPAAHGTLVDPRHDRVTIDGAPVPAPVPPRTLLLNKPQGVVSTRRDPQGRPTVVDLVDEPRGLFPVGRLDADSRGLLLLSSDGELTLRLTHPRYRVAKRYRVTVRGRAGERLLRGLRAGVVLDDGLARALEASLVGPAQGGDCIEVVVEEGRNRELRRLFAALGAHVLDLERVAVGPVRLGRLLEGQVRRLRPAEEATLYAAVGLAAPRGRPRPASAPPEAGRR